MLFENIGGKIKMVALASFVISTILLIIIALLDFITSGLMSILYCVLRIIAALIASWLTYGFGEIVDRIVAIDRKLKVTPSYSQVNNPAKPKALKSVQITNNTEVAKKLYKLNEQLEFGEITQEQYDVQSAEILKSKDKKYPPSPPMAGIFFSVIFSARPSYN